MGFKNELRIKKISIALVICIISFVAVNIAFAADATPPKYSRDSDNATSLLEEGELVRTSVYWNDSASPANLSTGELYHNASSGMSLVATKSFGGVNESWYNFTIDTTGMDGTICWKQYANDTAGNKNTSMSDTDHCFQVDGSPPQYSKDSDNSTGLVKEGELVKTSVYWEDDLAGLDTGEFYYNLSGSWEMVSTKSFGGTNADWYNFTIDTTDAGEKYVCWRQYASDTYGFKNTTMTNTDHCFHIDANPPQYSNDSDDAGRAVESGTEVNITVHWQDSFSNLDTAEFYTNTSGTWSLNSTESFTTSSGWFNTSINTTEMQEKLICWKQYANDTYGFKNTTMTNTDHCFHIDDSIPEYWNVQDNASAIIKEGTMVETSVYWNDTRAGLDTVEFYHNTSGSMIVEDLSKIHKIWQYSTNGAIRTKPVAYGNRIYFGSSDNYTYAVRENGSQLWNYSTDGAVLSSPIISNGVLYVGSNDQKISALNATTGIEIWNYSTNGAVKSDPLVWEDKVYFGSDDNNIYALNATTGTKLWNYTTGGDITSSPTLSEGIVYIGSKDNNIYALNATTGTKLWNYTTEREVNSDPTVVNNTVYVGSDDYNIYAFNITNGNKIWNHTTGGPIRSKPLIYQKNVYVGSSDYNLYALNITNGNKIWNYSSGDVINTNPTAYKGKIYFGSMDYYIYSLNATTGNRKWEHSTEGSVGSSPLIEEGIIYVGSDDNNLYALGQISESGWYNFTIDTTGIGEKYICWKQYANDSLGHKNTAMANTCFHVEANPPQYSKDSDDAESPVKGGTIINVSVYWQDTLSDLDTAEFYHNASGTMQVENTTTFTTSSGWFNTSVNTSNVVGNTVCWKQYANDTYGFKNTTMTNTDHCFQVDNNEPYYSDDSDDSGGLVKQGTEVNITVHWQDSFSNLDTAEFYTNSSGSWSLNSTKSTFTTSSGWFNTSINTTEMQEKLICWKQYANDTAGNKDTSMTNTDHCFHIDANPPKYSRDSDDSNDLVRTGSKVNVSVYWQDTLSDLDTAEFYHNASGTMQVENTTTFTTSSGWFNTSIDTTGVDGMICWKQYANDTYGFKNTTMTNTDHCFHADSSKPAYSKDYDNSTGLVKEGELVKTSVQWSDSNLAFGEFYHNTSGDMKLINSSSLSPASDWYNVTINTTDAGEKYVCWKQYANDTVGNKNTVMGDTDHCFHIDANPPQYSKDSDDAGDNRRVEEGTEVNITVHWQDTLSDLGTIEFYHNGDDDWGDLDDSCSPTGKSAWCNATIDTSGKGATSICWKQYANDTYGFKNTTMTNTDHCFYVIPEVENEVKISKGTSSFQVEAKNSTKEYVGYINGESLTYQTPPEHTDEFYQDWHHVILSYNGSHEKLYVDGELKNSSKVSGLINQVDRDLTLQGEGRIDEVRIYNKALSQNQVRTLYEKGRKDKQEIGGAWLSREGGKLYGDLDMNDNSIENFFGGECRSGEVATQIYSSGDYQCDNVNVLIRKVERWVNESGDRMNGTLNMQNMANITGVQRLGINTTQPDYGALQVNYEGATGLGEDNTHPISIRGHDQALLLGADTDTTAGYLQSYSISGSSTSDLSLNPQGGNVGIGVTDPSTKLHVGGELLLPNDNYLSWIGSGDGVKNVMKLDSNNDLIVNGVGSLSFNTGYLDFQKSDGTSVISFENGNLINTRGDKIANIQGIEFTNNNIRIGENSVVGPGVNDAVVIGRGADASGDRSTVIGNNSEVNDAGSIVIGEGLSGSGSVIGSGISGDISGVDMEDTYITGDIKGDNIDGNNILSVSGNKLVEHTSYENIGANPYYKTSYKASNWECMVAGWKAEDFDLDENDGCTFKATTNATAVIGNTMYEDKYWVIDANMCTHNGEPADWSVNLICIRQEIIK